MPSTSCSQEPFGLARRQPLSARAQNAFRPRSTRQGAARKNSEHAERGAERILRARGQRLPAAPVRRGCRAGCRGRREMHQSRPDSTIAATPSPKFFACAAKACFTRCDARCTNQFPQPVVVDSHALRCRRTAQRAGLVGVGWCSIKFSACQTQPSHSTRSWLGLPWIIKPLWSPVVDLLKTRRQWIWAMQLCSARDSPVSR